MLPLERQLTSPADQAFARQPTSPFDLTGDGSIKDDVSALRDKVKSLGEHKFEVAVPSVKLIINLGEAGSSVVVTGGGADGARVGERLEVTDWANGAGMAASMNGKRCFLGGSLAAPDAAIDAKAVKAARKFTQALTDAFNAGSFTSLITAVAKIGEESGAGVWRAQCMGSCMHPDYAFKPL